MTERTEAAARAAAAKLAAWLAALPPDERELVELTLAAGAAALGARPVDEDTAGFAAAVWPAPATAFGYARLLRAPLTVEQHAARSDAAHEYLLSAAARLVAQGG